MRKKSIEYLQELAQKFNGECLSNAYSNMNTKYLWRCKIGHEWTVNTGAWNVIIRTEIIIRAAWNIYAG